MDLLNLLYCFCGLAFCDVVVDFLKVLGFRPARSAEEFQKLLRGKLGEEV